MLSLPILSPVLCLSWYHPNKLFMVLSLCQHLPSGGPTIPLLRGHRVKPSDTDNTLAAVGGWRIELDYPLWYFYCKGPQEPFWGGGPD